MNTRSESGFTLLEMMIAILIVGILSAISMATYAGAQNMGYNADAKSNLHYSVTAAKTYYTAHDSSYAGMGANTLADEAPGINFRDGGNPVTPGAVYVSRTSAGEFVMKCKSLSGRVYTAIGSNLAVTFDF